MEQSEPALRPRDMEAEGALTYVRELIRSARRPGVFRQCATIAVVVGTLLTLVNQMDVLTGARADNALMIRIAANYVIPFAVANLGALSTPRRDG